MSNTVTISRGDKQKLIETFNSNPSGAFLSIRGYESVTGHGEIANYQIQSGIHYGNIVAMSIKELEDIKAGRKGVVHVKCNTYKNDGGTFTNKKAKGRALVVFEGDFKQTDPEFQMACDELMEGLKNPREVTNPYEKEANGLYNIDGDQNCLYIRECLVLHKTVVQHGTRPVSATTPFMALKRVIDKMLPVSNYRTFKIDMDRFETIAINHTEIVPF